MGGIRVRGRDEERRTGGQGVRGGVVLPGARELGLTRVILATIWLGISWRLECVREEWERRLAAAAALATLRPDCGIPDSGPAVTRPSVRTKSNHKATTPLLLAIIQVCRPGALRQNSTSGHSEPPPRAAGVEAAPRQKVKAPTKWFCYQEQRSDGVNVAEMFLYFP